MRPVRFHDSAINLQPRCNIQRTSCPSRHPGAVRRIVMEVAAAVMMFSIVLYFIQQFNVDPW